MPAQYMVLRAAGRRRHLVRRPATPRRRWRCWSPPAPAHWCWRRRPPRSPPSPWRPARHPDQGRGVPRKPGRGRCGGVRQDRHVTTGELWLAGTVPQRGAGSGACSAGRQPGRGEQPSGQPRRRRAACRQPSARAVERGRARPGGFGTDRHAGRQDGGVRPARPVREPGCRPRRAADMTVRSPGSAAAANSSAGCCSPTSRVPRPPERWRELRPWADAAAAADRRPPAGGAAGRRRLGIDRSARRSAAGGENAARAGGDPTPAIARWWSATASTIRWR